MKIKEFIIETFQTVSINGVLYSLNTDEKEIYKKVKEAGKLLKSDLSEFDARIANDMVTKGLLKRRKNPQHQIYFVTKGRRKCALNKPIEEVAPPDHQIEKWIEDNKEKFQEKYGKEYKKYLYGKAWNKFNGKKMVKESIEDNTPKFVKDNTKVFANVGDVWTNIYNHRDYEVSDIEFLDFTYEGKIFKSPLYILKNMSNDVEQVSTCNNYQLFRDFKKVQYDWDGEDDEQLNESYSKNELDFYKRFEGTEIETKNDGEVFTIVNVEHDGFDIRFKLESNETDTTIIANLDEMKKYVIGFKPFEDEEYDEEYWDGEDDEQLNETVYHAKYKKGQKLINISGGDEYTISHVDFERGYGFFYVISKKIGEDADGIDMMMSFRVSEKDLDEKYEDSELVNNEEYWDGEDEE